MLDIEQNRIFATLYNPNGRGGTFEIHRRNGRHEDLPDNPFVHMIILRQGIPESVARAATGMPLSSIVSLPGGEGLTIRQIEVRTVGDGDETRIELEYA